MAPIRIKGDCETCIKSVNVMLTIVHGDKMCDDCIAAEGQVVARADDAASFLAQSKITDSHVNIKADLFMAATIPAIELKAAIDADENIPADQKDYEMARQSLERFKQFQQAIFEERKALLAKENAARMWQTQVQEFAGKLRAELKEQFKTHDMNYTPVTPKTPKPKAVKSGNKKPSMAEIKAAAVKFGVDQVMVAMVANSRHMSAEDAAKLVADKLKPSVPSVASN